MPFAAIVLALAAAFPVMGWAQSGDPGFELLDATGIPGSATVTLTFNRPLGAGADDPANYRVTPGPGLTPQYAVLTASPADSLVVLGLHAPLAPSVEYAVAVDGVSDAGGVLLSPGSHAVFTTPAAETTSPYFLSAYGTMGSAAVLFRFTEPMGFGADDPANFWITPGPGGVGAYHAVSATPDGIHVRVELHAPIESQTGHVARIGILYDLNGNELSGPLLRQFTPRKPAVDATPPTLVSAAGTAGSNTMAVVFSEDVQGGASDPANYLVTPGPGGDPAHVVQGAQAAHQRVTLWLAAPLAPSGTYSVAVSGVADVAGNLIAPDSRAAFATASGETTPPTLVEAEGRAGSDRVRVVFSEPVAFGATSYANYLVTPGPEGAPSYTSATLVSGEDASVVTLVLTARLLPETDFTLHVSNVFDVSGNRIPPNSRVFFSTARSDPNPPRLVSAQGARASDRVVVRFDEPVTVGADDPARFTLTPGPGGSPAFPILSAVPGGSVVDLTLDGALAGGTLYVLTVEGVADTAGNVIEIPEQVSFETEPDPDLVAPVLLTADGSRGSDRVTVRFSEAVGFGATAADSYRLTPGPGGLPAFSLRSVSVAGSAAELKLSGLLSGSTAYTLEVSGVADPSGNLIAPGSRATFTTGGAPPWDPDPPLVESAVGERGSDIVTVRFSEPVAGGADDVAAYRLVPGPGGIATFPLRSASPDGATVELRVLGLLAASTEYVLTVQGVADTAGNVVGPGASAVFVTGAAPGDTVPPVLLSARGDPGATGILVTFSEPVEVGADVPANYLVNLGMGMPAAFAVLAAVVDGHHVGLTLSGSLAYGTTYYLTVSDVYDTAGNLITPQSRVSFRTGAPRIDPPVVALHLKSHAQKLWCTSNAPTGSCDDFTIGGSTGVAYDLYVVVVDPAVDMGIAGVAFGISYPRQIATIGWSRCADVEFPGQGFPASGGGNSITWDRTTNCQRGVAADEKIHAVAGHFYVYAYDSGEFAVTRRNTPVPDLAVADCAARTVAVPYPSGAGRVGFGIVPGYNPCEYRPPLNVETTTWGAIKRVYGAAREP